MPVITRARKNNKLNFFVAENVPFGDPFLGPKIPSKKFMWVPFCVHSQARRHINFFLWAQNVGGVLVGGQKVYVEKVYVLFSVP